MRENLHEMNEDVRNRKGYELNPGKIVYIERKFDPYKNTTEYLLMKKV
jgi:hypothetical protein